jgi:hypothetical protein
VKREFGLDLKGKEIKDELGNILGKVLFNHKNCGIAMVDKPALEELKSNRLNIDGMNTVIYDPVSLWESVDSDHKI